MELRDVITEAQAKDFIEKYHLSGTLREDAHKLLARSRIAFSYDEGLLYSVKVATIENRDCDHVPIYCVQRDIDKVLYVD